MEAKKAREEIVKKLRVRETTFYTWLRRYGDILEKEGIIKYTRKGKKKELAEVDVERFIEFIERRGEKPKDTIKREHLFIKALEDFLVEESNKGNFVVLKNPTLIEQKEEFSFDFICIFPSAIITFYSRSSFVAKEFLDYLSKLLSLQEKLKGLSLYHFVFYITKTKIDESSIEVLLKMKKENLKIAVYVCYTDENIRCCIERFKEHIYHLEDFIYGQSPLLNTEDMIFTDEPHILNCRKPDWKRLF